MGKILMPDQAKNRARDFNEQLRKTNELEQKAIERARDDEIEAVVDDAFRDAYKDGATGAGRSHRSAFSFSLPWQKTIINGVVIEE